MISNERSGRRELPAVAARAGALLDEYIASGTTLVRTHVDVDLDSGVTAIGGVIEAATSRADAIDVQIVAFPQSGMLVAPGTIELLDAAMSAGAHLVGGIDPAGFDGDPVKHLDAIFAIAERHGCGVDLHLHDRGALGRWDPLDLLDQHGVAVCLGQDGIRDLWSPWGDADMLNRAGLMAWRAGYRRDADIERCVDIATTRGAAAIGVDDHGLAPGCRGDVVLVDVACPAEAAVTAPPRTAVVKAGKITDVKAFDRGRQ